MPDRCARDGVFRESGKRPVAARAGERSLGMATGSVIPQPNPDSPNTSDRGTERPDLAGPRDRCGRDCAAFVAKWENWYDRTFAHSPPALVAVTGHDQYAALIGSKSRNMLRKAIRHGYHFDPINRNDHLDEIHRINRSKAVRSGGPMRQPYLDPPTPIGRLPKLCERHLLVSGGVFAKFKLDKATDEFARGELRAYCHLAIVNELAVINTILGHAHDLPNGIMNLLIASLVEQLHERNRLAAEPYVKWLNYTTLEGPEGLVRFKQSVGFR